MSKKFLFIFFVLLCFPGCGKSDKVVNQGKEILKPVKVVKKSDESVAICVTDESDFSIVLKNGQVVKYYDSVDGELGQDTIDIINSEHLVGVTSDDRAISIMNGVMEELGGHCEKEKE